MKTLKLKTIVCALSVTLLTTALVGCGSSATTENNNNQATQEQAGDKVEGTVTSLGSTALQPLVEEVANNFLAKYPKAIINVQGGGSGAGINQVAEGTVEIGNSDVLAEDKIKDESVLKELVDHKVCAIGFAMVTSKDVEVSSLTEAQIKDIFQGKITNWKEVGGKDMAINIVNREASSGTRATFSKTILSGESEAEGIGTVQSSSGAVRNSLKQVEGGISYLALSYINEDVKKDLNVIKINDVEANYTNVAENKYPFWSYEHMYTKGEPQGLTKTFLDYMLSPENEEIIEKAGYLPSSKIN